MSKSSALRRYIRRNFPNLFESNVEKLDAVYLYNRSTLHSEITKLWLQNGKKTVYKLKNQWIYESLFLSDQVREHGDIIWKKYLEHVTTQSANEEDMRNLVLLRNQLKDLMRRDLGQETTH